jgi:Mg2+ and Co2+ transporter CorA
MLDDLCYYLRRHAQHINLAHSHAPTFFVKKIITCHYALQLEYLRRIILKTQQKLAHHIDLKQFTIPQVESQWSEVQTLERRLSQNCRDLMEIMAHLRIPEGNGQEDVVVDWKDTASDFRFLHRQYQSLQHCSEMLNSSITGLASIVGNRHSFREQRLSQQAAERSVEEAKRARALVVVGLLFIPLSLTSSLFSMSQPYGPGQDKFWIYIAVSFPLTALVLFVYYIFDNFFLQPTIHRNLINPDKAL